MNFSTTCVTNSLASSISSNEYAPHTGSLIALKKLHDSRYPSHSTSVQTEEEDVVVQLEIESSKTGEKTHKLVSKTLKQQKVTTRGEDTIIKKLMDPIIECAADKKFVRDDVNCLETIQKQGKRICEIFEDKLHQLREKSREDKIVFGVTLATAIKTFTKRNGIKRDMDYVGVLITYCLFKQFTIPPDDGCCCVIC